MLSVRAVYEIAQVKAEDECFKMRNTSLETVVKNIIGSARSLGIKVVNDAVAERNSLQGKKWRRVYGREGKRGRDGVMMMAMMRPREE
ncbi:39S ribosomal protein L11, mitochondrial [Lates japonicus]|uniref:39S ribosomal protein L11, mitochondrial n=1 Tax=Lates japonicus TaxID=270547 RepID=A0AAD3NEF9_LATJO|nr:39S ribosomal protein L11, mitochondrial [Lates japonicus]